jgi:hypothetical protein
VPVIDSAAGKIQPGELNICFTETQLLPVESLEFGKAADRQVSPQSVMKIFS